MTLKRVQGGNAGRASLLGVTIPGEMLSLKGTDTGGQSQRKPHQKAPPRRGFLVVSDHKSKLSLPFVAFTTLSALAPFRAIIPTAGSLTGTGLLLWRTGGNLEVGVGI